MTMISLRKSDWYCGRRLGIFPSWLYRANGSECCFQRNVGRQSLIPLHIPFRPVLSSTALVDNETGRDGEESCMSREMPSMGLLPKKRVRQRGDVVVQIPARRPEQNREKRRDLIRRRLPRNGCKIVGLGAQRGPISQGGSSANVL